MRQSKVALALLAGLGAAYLLPLAAHAGIGLFTRYWADDFCTAAVARALGLIQAERYWYMGWSGRYAYVFAVDLASLIGPGVAPVLPGVLIALWLGVLTWALLQLPLFRASLFGAAVLATILVSATLSAIPNVTQSLYWRNSSLTYTAPVIVGSLLAGVVLRQNTGQRQSSNRLLANGLLVFGLAFMAGGFSEIYTALQLALFGLGLAAAMIGAWPSRLWRACAPWLAGLLGSAAALAAIALAPGTRARQSSIAAPPGLGSLIDNSLQYSRWFVRDAFLQHTPLILAVAAAGALVAAVALLSSPATHTGPRRWLAAGLLAVPVIAFGLLVACFAPAFYALLYLPPDRVLIINWFVWISATAAWGILAGLLATPMIQAATTRWPRPLSLAALAGVVGLVATPALAAALDTAAGRSAAQSYASTWDGYDQMLTAAQGGTITLARLNTPGNIDNLSDDPQFWTNQCLTQYYGVSVRAVAPPPAPSPADLAARTPLQATIGGVAQVLGYHLEQSSVRAGEALTVTVYWRPVANTDRPYTVFVHLYNPTAGSLGQTDGYPGQGQYLTTVWIHGQPFADTYRVPVRAGAPAGPAMFIVGLYDLPTGQRLPVSGADAGAPGQDWVQFGQVQVGP
jgi:Family of unknown function (DUF6056)